MTVARSLDDLLFRHSSKGCYNRFVTQVIKQRNVGGRPPLTDTPLVRRQIQLSELHDRTLRELSVTTRISVNALVREAIEAMLARILEQQQKASA